MAQSRNRPSAPSDSPSPDVAAPPASHTRNTDATRGGIHMRRVRHMLLASLAIVAIGATAALAGNAHFIKSATSVQLSGANLSLNFKEAGLASGSVETVQASALATTTYECVNGGGHNPSASNKTTTQTAV